MARKLLPIKGVRVKFRTEERDGQRIATAAIWLDEVQIQEIATLNLTLVERPGDPSYQGWVDSISTAFNRYLSRRTGWEVNA